SLFALFPLFPFSFKMEFPPSFLSSPHLPSGRCVSYIGGTELCCGRKSWVWVVCVMCVSVCFTINVMINNLYRTVFCLTPLCTDQKVSGRADACAIYRVAINVFVCLMVLLRHRRICYQQVVNELYTKMSTKPNEARSQTGRPRPPSASHFKT
ncbi:MAG: hypothetical protein ACKESB_03440, partial [Candidatus Hodgkinia cicadicola]